MFMMMMMMMMSGSFECARRYTLNADCQNELSDYYNWSLIRWTRRNVARPSLTVVGRRELFLA